MCNIVNESVNRQRERSFHSFYSYALLPLNICQFGRVQNEWTHFWRVENIREYFRRVESTFKAPCIFLDASHTFWTRRRNFLLYFNVIFDASYIFPTRPERHWIRVAYFHDASKMYRTRRQNMLLYFNVILDASCKFATRRKLHLWLLRQNN